jgi:ribosome biogenesis GTPase A
MSLQWYPGHMTKARRELAALMPSQDVVIEVLDARLPASSENPLITELRRDKPCIKVLTRSDLADPEVTQAWLAHFRKQPNVSAIESTTDRQNDTRKRISELLEGAAQHRGASKRVRALIAGVPNVGKSTLINTLMHRTVAAVGDKPAITKQQQAVLLKDGTTLTDSPGLLWPKIVDEHDAFRLALAGSIPDTAIDYLTIAMFAAATLLERYPALLIKRYKLPSAPASAEALLTEIGKRRGCLRPGGIVDLDVVSQLLVREFRAGSIGRITLEDPQATPPALRTES